MPSYKILVTGSRNWSDRRTMVNAFNDILKDYHAHDITVIEGGCRGADLIAKSIAEFLGMNIIEFPANWVKYGRGAGFMRNAEMVSQKPDIVLAFPMGKSPGTRHCISLAKVAGIEVKEYMCTDLNDIEE